MTPDVLIVGGGIGGLVLAELLGRGGKKVVVLERSTGPPPWNRPEILWPATQELLCSLIPRERWLQEAVIPLRGMQFFSGSEFRWAISPEMLERAQIQPWSTNPNLTRELLMRLESFELQRGVEVKEVLKNQDRVIGVRALDVATGSEREWLAPLTVGDDGGHSLVRAACGIELKTQLFPLDLVCFQVDWPAGFPPDVGRLWPNLHSFRSGLVALGILPTGQKHGVGLVPARPRVFDNIDQTKHAWQERRSAVDVNGSAASVAARSSPARRHRW